ncbi:MAG TPA: VWA domain-containing protein [Vicinamibacterales bacterium]|nr:VWA domain-containing protein [Vicinamibacterales bacterium]
MDFAHFIPSSSGLVTLMAGLVMGGALPAAPANAQEAPIFRSGVDLITVDATVVGPDGHADPRLGRDDFVLKVDGKVRRVVSAQFVRHTSTAEEASSSPRFHFSSNEFLDPGRLVVVAVDEPHIRRAEGRTALEAAGKFIDGLPAADRVAVLGIGRSGTIEFTRDRALARRRLTTLSGQADPVFLQFNLGLSEAVEIADGSRTRLADVVLRECGQALTNYINPARAIDEAATGVGRDACPEQVEQESRAMAQHARTQARISLSALENLVASVSELERPTTVVLLSEGLVADPRLIDFSEFAARAQEARVSIYVLHMETPLFEAATDRLSPTFLKDVQVRGDGLARLAGSAKGAVFRLVGSDPAPFQRIANELAGHYLIAFEPLASERDGRVHRIELSVTNARGQIRARQAFRLPVAVRSARAREEDLVTLLRSAQPATELPVRVATYTYVEPVSAQVRVVVSTEAEASSGPNSGVVLGYVLVDTNGVIAASGALRSEAGRHAFTTRVTAGSYTLRVGSIDALGRRGLVERTFTAAVRQQGGVQISDLILAPAPAGPDIPLHPIIDRIDETRMVAYLELAAQAARPLNDVRVRFELIGEDDTARRPEFAGDVVASGSLWASARVVMPLDGLPRGRYVVVAKVMSGEQEVARTARPFTIP